MRTYILISAVVVFLSGFTLGAIVTDSKITPHLKKEIAELKERETHLVGRLHKLHGIDASECVDGKYYFWHNGIKNIL